MGGGGGCRVSANEYSSTHGAQVNFEDLTPNLTLWGYAQLVMQREVERKDDIFFGPPNRFLPRGSPHAYNGVDEDDKEYEESDVKQRNHRHQDGVEHNLQTCKNETSESGRCGAKFFAIHFGSNTAIKNCN